MFTQKDDTLISVYAAVNSADQNITQGAVIMQVSRDCDGCGETTTLNLSIDDANTLADELMRAVKMYEEQDEELAG